ncbi:MAG: UMP kinase [Candidatus Cloacimonetes bacterium]|nr:UMP kinase [Candidatus Cloacimonadota bacterium]
MRTFKPEKINRIIFKISGEVLAGPKGFGIDIDRVNEILADIISLKKKGYSIGIVLGGGNFFRGASEVGDKISRHAADNVGMLATIQNAILLSGLLKCKNYPTEVYSAVQVDKIAKFYSPDRAKSSLNKGKICFFCAGTGNPFFTTDTAAVLRGIELDADIIFKGTKVNGVFTSDPVKNKNAEFISKITFSEVLAKELKVMDMTAFSLAREYKMPIKVFNINTPGNIEAAVLNKDVGTFVHA